MAYLNREQIQAAQDIGTETVSVPEWGGDVRIRGLSAKQRGLIVKRTTTVDKDGKVNSDFNQMQLLVVLVGCVDEDGHRLFSEADAEWLREKSAKALFRVFKTIAALSGMDGEAEEAAAKNSESTPSDDLLSD